MQEIMDNVKAFNKKFIREDLTEAERTEWTMKFIMYTQDELMEVLEELPFKHWKSYDDFQIDENHIREEIADVLIFTLGMASLYDMDVKEEIMKKMDINFKRQEVGY